MKRDAIIYLGLGFMIGALAMELRPRGGSEPQSPTSPVMTPAPAPPVERLRVASPAPLGEGHLASGAAAVPATGAALAAPAAGTSEPQLQVGAAPAPATASAAASDEAIAAFKDLAKAGASAFGQHFALVEKFRALGPDGISILSELLRDPSSGSRFLAAAIFEGLKDPQSIPALDRAVADPDSMVGRMASHALALMGSRDALPALERALNESQDAGIRLNAAYGLGKLGEKSGNDFLLEQFRTPGNPCAIIVFGAMADIGAPEFSAALRPFIENAALDVGIRLGAIECAAKAKDGDALPALEGVIASPDSSESLREAAKRAAETIRGERR